MKLDPLTIKSNIRKGVIESFTQLVKEHPNIYSFALYSDDGCETLLTTSNTIEYAKKQEEKKGSPDLNYYYSPDEWDFSLSDKAESKEFYELSKLLRKNADEFDWSNDEEDKQFDIFQKSFYKVCIDVLIELRNESFFKKHFSKDLFILFSASDFEFSNSQEIEMIKSLNSNKYSDEYIKWIEGGYYN